MLTVQFQSGGLFELLYSIPKAEAQVYNGRWVQTWAGTCSSVCSAAGMVSAPSPTYGAYCTSGEAQNEEAYTQLGAGIYLAGCWNVPCGSSPRTVPLTPVGGYCYRDGQKRDYDATDITAACYCRDLTPAPECNDGLDNDGNGFTDYPNDQGCASASDNDESGFHPSTGECSDGRDNDGDGQIDVLEEGPHQGGQTTVTPSGTVTSTVNNSGDDIVLIWPKPYAIRFDDDSATRVCQISGYGRLVSKTKHHAGHKQRCYWSPEDNSLLHWSTSSNKWYEIQALSDYGSVNAHCIETVVCADRLPDCSDGADNDNDGQTDYPRDSGCASANDFSEIEHDSDCSSPSDEEHTPECRDGIDNDNDGATDHPNDFSCSNPDDDDESDPESACQDGRDNDGDDDSSSSASSVPTVIVAASSEFSTPTLPPAPSTIGSSSSTSQTIVALVSSQSSSLNLFTFEAECGDGSFDPDQEECERDRPCADTSMKCDRKTCLCKQMFCGDAIIHKNEECDLGEKNSDTEPNACRTNCSFPGCGDGVTDFAFKEECDDGNLRDNDGCSAQCIFEDLKAIPVCGNGALEPPEECDDGNRHDNDGCSANCVIGLNLKLVSAASLCGNGALEPPEECDDSNARDNDGCSATCLLEIGICGDGIIQKLLGEKCERNLHDPSLEYSCGTDCLFHSEFCGNGFIDDSEECDDGAKNSAYPDATCRPNCTLSRCGDEVVDSTETCDDGNRISNDGCDRFCIKEETEVALEIEFEAVPEVIPQPIPQLPFPQYPTYQPLPYQLPYAQLQPLIQTQGPAGDTGPAAVAVAAGGIAAGFGWVRRKRRKVKNGGP
jgi:cysteine-rich repeat protein